MPSIAIPTAPVNPSSSNMPIDTTDTFTDDLTTDPELYSLGDHRYATALLSFSNNRSNPAKISHALPRSYNQALDSPFVDFWMNAIMKELDSHEQNQTWSVVPRNFLKRLNSH